MGVRVLGVPPPVAHDADHGGDQQEEGGASRGAGDESDVGGLERPVLASAVLPEGSSGLAGVPRAA